MYRYLASAGLEHYAGNADYVANVHSLKVGIGFLAHIIPFYIYLNVALVVQYVRK